MNRVNVEAQAISVRQTANAVRKLTASMGEFAHVSEENASTVEQSSFALRQQAATVQELISEIDGIVDAAQELVDELGRFKVREVEV